MRQLRDTPPLLQKGLLLAGSLARRIDRVEDLQLPYALYQQAKEAIYMSSGSDTTTLLKAITITSCWSLRPPSVISLDGPWHWAGIAMRLALQLGLHHEKTYSGLRDSNSCRLVWWYLVNSDVLQAACWGRPCLIQSRCQDVQLPAHSDLDSLPLQTFNQVTRLLLILRQIIEPETSQLSDIVNALADWHRAVPLPLKLHSTDGSRNSYDKPGNEMFIIYFAIILLVLFQADRAENRQTPVSLISIAASSCIVRLYEEIHLHEDSPRLNSVHGFFLMLAAIPQIFHRTESAAKERLREHELDVICQVLQALHVKYGGSNMVLQKISKLRAESDALRESEPPPVNTGSYLESSTGAIDSSLLFPFPTHFSPNLGLLDDYENNSPRNGAMDLLAFESSLIDWSADDFFDTGDFPQSIDF
ncbi:hypothetical protein ASPVEDRAFT_85309 [Aspergillus versicolor CBS 583.65]|uniref:Xylanolytic transcriptional activator regulatory domain-containing protein n=1 Tax=Aspergillus versicolor CBS 583.65 TaxID=1036611 RepID=A0A1L9PR16_ASPVE|nr:uncharacterized protein ASPVEDRAFT_85309 [Aspergillus versicolor CBS 583.65]OJJ03886.1 hypothetical protein ASPVEDRAFT_85309 [Aspergillus versicolor CBS 583.65]